MACWCDLNFRPVSNLSFISKLLEKVVDLRLEQHLQSNALHEHLQSAYRKSHSTETALIKIKNDITESMDKGLVSVLVMLDSSAAFDTIDHKIVLSRLKNQFGIRDTALKWFESYLSYRFQKVSINGEISDPALLEFGVPQGSVLGPKLYTMYTKPMGAIIKSHNLDYHFYADDTQIYVSFNPLNVSATRSVIENIECCISDINLWMTSNKLKLNGDKTDVMLFTSSHSLRKFRNVSLVADEVLINSVSEVKTLGVYLDSSLNMDTHVNHICKQAYFQLRNIGQIRRYLAKNATISLINGLVTSKLDYCNSLMYGLSEAQLRKLQRVQNTAARIITRS